MPSILRTNNSTLSEFEDFLTNLFGDYGMLITVRAAHHSWLTFECTIPSWSVSLFNGLIEKNASFIKSEGVSKISIGGNTIYEVC